MKKTPNLLFIYISWNHSSKLHRLSLPVKKVYNTNESLLISSNANTQGTVHVKGIVSNTDVKTDSDNITQIYTTHFEKQTRLLIQVLHLTIRIIGLYLTKK